MGHSEEKRNCKKNFASIENWVRKSIKIWNLSPKIVKNHFA